MSRFQRWWKYVSKTSCRGGDAWFEEVQIQPYLTKMRCEDVQGILLHLWVADVMIKSEDAQRGAGETIAKVLVAEVRVSLALSTFALLGRRTAHICPHSASPEGQNPMQNNAK